MYIKLSRTFAFVIVCPAWCWREKQEVQNYKCQNRRCIFFVLDYVPDVMGEADVPDKFVIAVWTFHSIAFYSLCECSPF